MYSLPYSQVSGFVPVSSECRLETGMMARMWEGNYQGVMTFLFTGFKIRVCRTAMAITSLKCKCCTPYNGNLLLYI